MITGHMSWKSWVVAGTGLLLAGFGAAHAQGYDTGFEPPAQQETMLDDEKLAAFVYAETQVVQISEEWNARMQSAESPEAAQELREQAQAQMVTAVQEAGLSVQEYNEIAMAAQTDPDLQARLQQIREAGF
jgi:predicted ATPase with chaperone activity